MDLILASNERIIKDWHYATETTKTDKEDCYLAVTNKRVVFGVNRSKGFSRDEILIEHIQRVSTSYEKSINMSFLTLCILGFLIICAGILVGMVYVPNTYIIIAGCVVGAVLIISGIAAILSSRRAQFSLLIYTSASDEVGVQVNTALHRHDHLPKQVTKVKVNTDVAREIVNTLGAMVIAQEKPFYNVVR